MTEAALKAPLETVFGGDGRAGVADAVDAGRPDCADPRIVPTSFLGAGKTG